MTAITAAEEAATIATIRTLTAGILERRAARAGVALAPDPTGDLFATLVRRLDEVRDKRHQLEAEAEELDATIERSLAMRERLQAEIDRHESMVEDIRADLAAEAGE